MLRSCTRRLRQRRGTSQRHIFTGGICSGQSVFLVHCSTMIEEQVSEVAREAERVEPEITVRNFGPATSERPFRIYKRIGELRRDYSERGNM